MQVQSPPRTNATSWRIFFRGKISDQKATSPDLGYNFIIDFVDVFLLVNSQGPIPTFPNCGLDTQLMCLGHARIEPHGNERLIDIWHIARCRSDQLIPLWQHDYVWNWRSVTQSDCAALGEHLEREQYLGIMGGVATQRAARPSRQFSFRSECSCRPWSCALHVAVQLLAEISDFERDTSGDDRPDLGAAVAQRRPALRLWSSKSLA